MGIANNNITTPPAIGGVYHVPGGPTDLEIMNPGVKYNDVIPHQIDSAGRPPQGETTRQQMVVRGVAGVLGQTIAPLPGDYTTYREMLKDPTIALARAVAWCPILSAGRAFEAKSEADPDMVKLLKDTLEPLLPELIYQALRALDLGWMPFEKVWETRSWKDSNGSTRSVFCIQRLKALLPDLTTPLLDVNGRLFGFRNGNYAAGYSTLVTLRDSDLGLDKVFVYTYDKEGDSPFGRPRLENCREPWNRSRGVELNADRLGRKAAGTVGVSHYPVGTSVDENGKEIDNFTLAIKTIKDLADGKCIAVPNMFITVDNVKAAPELAGESAWKFDFEDAGNPGPALQGLIEERRYLDALKLRGYLVPERATTETGSGGGSRADSETHGDVGVSIAESLHKEILACINRDIVDPILEYNFGPEAKGEAFVTTAGLSRAQRQFYEQIFMALLNNPATVDWMVGRMKVHSLMDQLEVPQVEGMEDDDESIIGQTPGQEALTPEQQKQLDESNASGKDEEDETKETNEPAKSNSNSES